jgi:hypothetical protein
MVDGVSIKFVESANLVYTLGVAEAVAFTPSVSAIAEMLVNVTSDNSVVEYFLDVESIGMQGSQVTALVDVLLLLAGHLRTPVNPLRFACI